MQFNYKYGGSSSVTNSANSTGMSFAPDALRQPTFFVGKLNNKIPFREAISALNAVVVSDLRFKPKDRTAYLEWYKSQEEFFLAEYMNSLVGDVEAIENRIKTLRKEIERIDTEQNRLMKPYWEARSKYYSYLYEKDRDTWFVLDPVITVNPDELFFECFSQDESMYGKLSCSYNVFKNINQFECGTTNVDYSADLYNEFQKIRNYKETEFKVDPSGFEVQTGTEDVYKEVKIDLPDTWVRGFLQVSSAMTMPAIRFDLHPTDIYNICLMLRRYKEIKSPRSMKYILRPNEPIRIIFEPWNHEVVCHRSIFKGAIPQEVRLWGRRRLLALERLIPVATKFTVTLMGTGMPSFYEAHLGDMIFTLGLSGWTANDWSRAGNFDLLAPRADVDDYTKQAVFNALKEVWVDTADSLANRLGLTTDIVKGALAAYTQAGRVIYDMDKGKYRVRELSRDPLPMEKLRFANEREEKASQFLKESKTQILRSEFIHKGTKIVARVVDKNRTHEPELVIDNDERLIEAHCDCYFHNTNQMRLGPCEHILAARMAWDKQYK